MDVQFYSQEDSLSQEHALSDEDWLNYWSLEPHSHPLLDEFHYGEIDKLAPWTELCDRQGIQLNYFLNDTIIRLHQLPQVLANLRQCYGIIAQRRPFVHPSEIHKDAYVRMVTLLGTAIQEEHGIQAFIP